jgi:hypothetical protein
VISPEQEARRRDPSTLPSSVATSETDDEGATLMSFAYADPPYLGCCKLYDHHHPSGVCWDRAETHLALIAEMTSAYRDGWALSASSPSLRTILPMCPADVRVGAWVKTFSTFKKGVRPAYAWEPVIFWRGRNPNAGHPHPPPVKGGAQTTPKDFHETWAQEGIACPITLRKGLTGAKPAAFCDWVLDLLNVQPGDVVVDLFPGTGIFGERAALRLGGEQAA